MKNSVNGKTFDEIFTQRGKQINENEMIKGGVYFLEGTGLFDKIIRFFSYQKETNGVEIVVTKFLFNDGYFGLSDPEARMGVLRRQNSAYFEATQDQIDLLKTTKNEL